MNLQELLKGKEVDLHGRKVTLRYISDDPAGFGQAALEMARLGDRGQVRNWVPREVSGRIARLPAAHR